MTDRQRSSRISPDMPNRYQNTESVCSCFSAYTTPAHSLRTKEDETIFKSVKYNVFLFTLLQKQEFTGNMNWIGIGNRLCRLLNQKLRIAERQAKRGFKLFIYKYQAYPLQLFLLEQKVRFKSKYSLCLQKLHTILKWLESKTDRKKIKRDKHRKKIGLFNLSKLA